jgi:polyisoprenoid-binding protein YceI
LSTSSNAVTSTDVPTGLATWALDSTHSIAEFAVKHMVVATAKGRFGAVEGTLQWDGQNFATASVNATIDVTTISTGDVNRDSHLKSDDFFNAEQFPTATFRSKRIDSKDSDEFKLVGDLTIRDVTKEVTLDVEFEGQVKDPYGLQRSGFTAQTSINRREFGLNWNAMLEAGGAVVADKVKITIHAEFTRPA